MNNSFPQVVTRLRERYRNFDGCRRRCFQLRKRDVLFRFQAERRGVHCLCGCKPHLRLVHRFTTGLSLLFLSIALLGCAFDLPNFAGDAPRAEEADAADADPTVMPLFDVESTSAVEQNPSTALTPEPTVAAAFSAERATPVAADAATTDTALLDAESNISSSVATGGADSAQAENVVPRSASGRRLCRAAHLR